MEFQVAGVTFKNDETGVRRQEIICKVYDDHWTENRMDAVLVQLRPEPTNPVDPNAIGVWVFFPHGGTPEGRVGFVPADQIARVRAALDTGRAVVTVSNMVCGKRNVSMTISLMLKKVKP